MCLLISFMKESIELSADAANDAAIFALPNLDNKHQ
jgi:hypothetical protein